MARMLCLGDCGENFNLLFAGELGRASLVFRLLQLAVSARNAPCVRPARFPGVSLKAKSEEVARNRATVLTLSQYLRLVEPRGVEPLTS